MVQCSDGGFITANSKFPGSAVRGQIVVDNNGKPMSKPYTGGTIVDNSKLFANMLAWAINQAQINGINKK
jgi:hypothetical protein